jgi:hypothetical protein
MMHVLDTTAFSAVMRRDAGILSLLKKKKQILCELCVSAVIIDYPIIIRYHI